MGWIDREKMIELAEPMKKNQYGQYLLQVIDEIARTGIGGLNEDWRNEED